MTLLMASVVGMGIGTTIRSPSYRELEDRNGRADKLRSEIDGKLEASKNEVSLLHVRVMTLLEDRFEERNDLHSSLEACTEKDGVARCSASTDTGTPVSYHCTVEKCEIDCSPR